MPTEPHETIISYELPCEGCEKLARGHKFYSAAISSCASGTDCHYAGHQFHSIIVAQLEDDISPKKPVGTLTLLFNDQNQHVDQTRKTVLSFARLISIIVERNKTNRDAMRAELMADRQAIANDIHDSLAQTLVYARMRTSLLLESIRNGNEVMSAKYANDIEEALEISQKNARELIKDFRCAMDPSGLPNALQNLTEQFGQRNKISLEYVNRVAHLELPLEYEIQVFHIVQEALANIAAHSEATHARLIVDFSNNYYIFTIEDNGSGGCAFTPVEGHYGMMIMRERAQRIGGEINVRSSEEIGTHVQLFFPAPGTNWRTANE